MKKYSLLLALAPFAMLACTDYRAEINEAHDEYVNARAASDNTGIVETSGCQCAVVPSNVFQNESGDYVYDYAVNGSGSIYWNVYGCQYGYNIAPRLSDLTQLFYPGTAFHYDGAEYLRVEMTASPSTGTSVMLDVPVYKDGNYIENIDCHSVWVSPADAGSSAPFTPIESGSSDAGYGSSWVFEHCGNLWCGPEGLAVVSTGFDDEDAGLWYVASDKDVEGNSVIDFNTKGLPPDPYDYMLRPVIEAYGNIPGTVLLGDAYDYPYAALGFTLIDGKQGANISAWDGLCLVYESSMGFSLRIIERDEENVTQYNNYSATVVKSSKPTVADIPWSKFKQGSGWGTKVEQSRVLTDAASIQIRFEGTAGTQGSFVIYSVGRYGTCN